MSHLTASSKHNCTTKIIFPQAKAIKVHPWYIMIPATISCSFAFMLPVATPPNAIVFAGGHLKVKDMVSISHFFQFIQTAVSLSYPEHGRVIIVRSLIFL